MFFRKKGSLRREFDELLVRELKRLGTIRANQKKLLGKSFEPSEELICEAKITEVKILLSFKRSEEQKARI